LVLAVDEGEEGAVAVQPVCAQLHEGVERRVGIEERLRQRPGRQVRRKGGCREVPAT
jgi:hypothetical protein